jgi:hypothetical protein
MPVILATQEAEIRRITVRSQPHANNLRDHILKNTITKNRAGGVTQGEGPEFNPSPHKKEHINKTI